MHSMNITGAICWLAVLIVGAAPWVVVFLAAAYLAS
jgi:hypothetical protein